jgi:AcrR family transcriptional regulator
MSTGALSPRERLLETASGLFYSEGIHSVGVDRLVSEAGVTRATFYRHFPTKEALVEAYLRATDERLRTNVENALKDRDPQQALEALLDLIGQRTNAPGFRGCQFINAAAEYPDGTHPVHVAVDDHRAWFQRVATEIARKIGHPNPDEAGQFLVLLHDGALVAAELDDPKAVRIAVKKAALQLLAPAAPQGLSTITAAAGSVPSSRTITRRIRVLTSIAGTWTCDGCRSQRAGGRCVAPERRPSIRTARMRWLCSGPRPGTGWDS